MVHLPTNLLQFSQDRSAQERSGILLESSCFGIAESIQSLCLRWQRICHSGLLQRKCGQSVLTSPSVMLEEAQTSVANCSKKVENKPHREYNQKLLNFFLTTSISSFFMFAFFRCSFLMLMENSLKKKKKRLSHEEKVNELKGMRKTY